MKDLARDLVMKATIAATSAVLRVVARIVGADVRVQHVESYEFTDEPDEPEREVRS